ncbi:MAG: acylneuraminate cytidylyltransferase family protein [Boseongicola sp.]|nr:acylneuraminate cytidylyltransferase family protein [Boseongicola sp.]
MTGFIAVVPARAGSKGAPGKNTRDFAGVPLWRRAAEQGLSAGAEHVVVTTDIGAILIEEGLPSEFKLIARPKELADDSVPMAPVLMHALSDPHLAGTTIVLLQPTSPLRSDADIRAALTLYQRGDFDLVLSASEVDRGVLKFGTREGDRFAPLREAEHCFSNRQSLPAVWKPNGAVYVFARDWFLENAGFVTERIGMIEMPLERSFDIDTDTDFERTEAVFLKKG